MRKIKILSRVNKVADAESAEVAYAKKSKECRTMLRTVEAKLNQHEQKAGKNPKNWGYYGDLEKVLSDLTEASRSMGG